MIEGLKVVPLAVHSDGRGDLFEAIHNYDLPGGVNVSRGLKNEEYAQVAGRFGQVYFVSDPAAGAIRAFHKHRELTDWFVIVHGRALFVFVDDRNDRMAKDGVPDPGASQILVADAARPVRVEVPPGVYHGWMSLTPDTLLCSVADRLYNRENPDEHRVPPEAFTDSVFGGESPWIVKGR